MTLLRQRGILSFLFPFCISDLPFFLHSTDAFVFSGIAAVGFRFQFSLEFWFCVFIAVYSRKLSFAMHQKPQTSSSF